MLKVVKAQGQGIVSDSGRWGFQHQGVPVGGVLDDFSFQVANLALGNPTNSACLELMGQFDFVCASPCKVFLANRAALAQLNGKQVCSGRVLALNEGDLLRTQAPSLGFWNLLCIQGGVDVPIMMGSRSTCIAGGFGGYWGRALVVGDEIHAGREHGRAMSEQARLAMPLPPFPFFSTLTVHALAGPEFAELTEESQALFTSCVYRLGMQSSRMGYRLECDNRPLVTTKALGLKSHAVHPGLVQLPPSGQPVVLLSEAQVTGGYPRIASLLSCELWKLAHLGTGMALRWVIVEDTEARQLLQFHQLELNRYASAIDANRSKGHVD